MQKFSVTLLLISQACFDVREGPKVWQKFAAFEKLQDIPSMEWLSTHPSHENRERNLETIVPEVRTNNRRLPRRGGGGIAMNGI